MLGMRKNLLFCLLICLTTLTFLLFGCNRAETSVYTGLDGETQYTLTLDQKEQTFVLIEVKGEEKTRYEGTFINKDGSVVIAAADFGYRSVRLEGDAFVFIANPENMEEKDIPCEHTWDGGVYTAGNCVSYGYTTYTCTKCRETKTETDKFYGEHVSDAGTHVGGTCVELGATEYYCKICKQKLRTVEDTEFIGAHKFTATETIKDEGCTKIIKILCRCERCGVEEYQQDDSRAIGAHDYGADGICKKCKHLKNGLPSAHEYKNDSDICYHCGVKKSVLEGIVENPDGYTEGGKFYLGVYPQKAAAQTAKEIKANGLYDSNLDCWYYGHETYVIQKAAVRKDEGKTFIGGTETVVVGESYAFLLQPLAFTKVADKYVCDRIIDAGAFLQEAVLYNGGATNVWEESTLYAYLNKSMLKRIGASNVQSIDLLTEEELPEEKIKFITDYALAGGSTFSQNVGGREGKWYLKTPAEKVAEVRCVDYDGVVKDTQVTEIRGIVPVLTLKEGE